MRCVSTSLVEPERYEETECSQVEYRDRSRPQCWRKPNRGASNLGRESVKFFLGPRARKVVGSDGEVHGLLPDKQISVRPNVSRHLLPYYC